MSKISNDSQSWGFSEQQGASGSMNYYYYITVWGWTELGPFETAGGKAPDEEEGQKWGWDRCEKINFLSSSFLLQYQINGQMSRMEPCLMGSTPRLHPAPVAPRWPDVSPANSCYTSPPMHSSRYATSGDMYSPLGPRRNSEYEHSQHFPGFAYINGEATTGWAK